MTNVKTRSAIYAAALLLSLFSLCESAEAANNGNRVKPGEFIVDHPTLINLGFEWLIQGDDNRNAQVEVSYRKQGETQWKTGLPLLAPAGRKNLSRPGCV